jgi:protein SCO1/2
MSRLFFILFIAYIFMPSSALSHDHHSDVADEARVTSGESIYHLRSKWQNQSGEDVSISALRGQPVVLAMAYTSCQASCPLIVESMKKLEIDLSKKKIQNVVFAIFSFDSKRDTPDRLKSYAKSAGLNSNRWRLFHGTPDAVSELAAVLGVRYKKDSQGEFDHSNIISLLDSEGIIHFQQVGLGKETEIFEQKILELSIEKKK